MVTAVQPAGRLLEMDNTGPKKRIKVTIDLNEEIKKAKSQSYAELCTYKNCEEGETRAIVARYKPVQLTKLNKKR